ncbi:hypothetical protein BJ165DRAFT_1075416 [Panaeolus papilionaceus]|nr:hypothetical protein BJ165DRAFT_1075416 [Panaeolus papilionaceus]
MPWFWTKSKNQRQSAQQQQAPEQTSSGTPPPRQRTSRQTASQPDLHKHYPPTGYNTRPLPVPPPRHDYNSPTQPAFVPYAFSHPAYDVSRYYPQQPGYYPTANGPPPSSSNRYAFPQSASHAPQTEPYHHPREQPRPHHSSFPPIAPTPVEERRGRQTNTWPMNGQPHRYLEPPQSTDRPSRRDRSSRSREDVRAGGHSSSTRVPHPPSTNPYSARANLQAQQQHPISAQPPPRSQPNHAPVTNPRDVAHSNAAAAALVPRSQTQYPYGSHSAQRPSPSHENIHAAPHSRPDRHPTHPPVTESSTYHRDAARASRESLQHSRNRSRPDTPHSWDSSWQHPPTGPAPTSQSRRPATPGLVPQSRRPAMIRNDDCPTDQVAETEINGRPDHPLNRRPLPLYRDGDPKQFSMRSNLSNPPKTFPFVDWDISLPADKAVSCLTAENRAPYDTRIPIFQPPVTCICIKTMEHRSTRIAIKRWGGIVVWRRGKPLTISDVFEEIRAYFQVPLTPADIETFSPDMRMLVEDSHRQRVERDRKNGLDVSRERLRRLDTLLLQYRYAGLQFDPHHFWETRELYLRLQHVSWFKGLGPSVTGSGRR